MKRLLAVALSIALSLGASAARAVPGNFAIDQIFSNADGSIQFVVIVDHGATDCDAGENLWAGTQLRSLGAAQPRVFTFTTNLPTCHTSGRRMLIATQGFAALGLVTPDYVMPNDFIQRPAGQLVFADVSSVTYSALPADGVMAIDGNGAPVANVATNLAGASASVTAGAHASLDLNQHGLTGSWYEPATDGQGVEVEIFPDLAAPGTGFAQVSWFTYDIVAGGAERQRWYTLSGPVVSGQAGAALTIYRNTGGNFATGPVTTAQAVGSATLAFDSCTTGTLDYTFSDGSGRAGSIPLTRLTQNVTCSANAARPTNADFALSGNWYDAATSGQGITVEVNPLSAVFFSAWYTYVPNGAGAGVAGQRWFTAQAAGYASGTRSIAVQLYETTGGVFDTPTVPAAKTVVVGTGTFTFQSCAAATLAYAFTGGSSAGKSGTLTFGRIGPVPPGCLP